MQTKTLKQYSTLVFASAFTMFVIFLSSCGGDDAAPKPIADFTFVVDKATGVKVTFTNTSQNAITYAWSFGVTGATSTVESPEYMYTKSGAYTVVLTATSVDGSVETKSKTIPLIAIPQNVLLNGEFNDNSKWLILDTPDKAAGQESDFTYQNIFTFTDGKFNISANYLDPDGVSPSRTLGTLYQAVVLEAGTYQLSGEYFASGQKDFWMWIQLQPTAPVAGEFPAEGGDGNIMLLSFYNCKPNFSGNILDFGCRWDPIVDTNGIAEIKTAGTYYFMINAGQWESTYGTMGFNNIALKKIL